MTNITPTPGYILVEPQKKDSTTASGILLTDSQSDKTNTGKVLSLGTTFTTDFGIKKDAPCKVGDLVLYKEWGGTEYKQGDTAYMLVKFDDLIAIIN